MRILITGVTGFVGSHLAEFCLARKDVEVYGLRRWRSPLDNIRHIAQDIHLVTGDLRDLGSIMRVIEHVQPDMISHLAAQSYVPTSYEAPADTMEINAVGTVNLLEAIRHVGIHPTIHICSSSEVYGQVPKDCVPINENAPLRPASPYAVSKVAEDMLGYMYHAAYGLKTIRSRMFTHTGPRRGEVFATSAFAKQLAQIELGQRPPVLRVGNLESVRTFLDVRDAVRAYWDLLNKCTPGEVYNIGGTETMTIGDMLSKLLAHSSAKPSIQVDSALLRPTDVTLQIPDCTRFTKQTGWKPTIPIKQTLGDLLEYWRRKLREG